MITKEQLTQWNVDKITAFEVVTRPTPEEVESVLHDKKDDKKDGTKDDKKEAPNYQTDNNIDNHKNGTKDVMKDDKKDDKKDGSNKLTDRQLLIINSLKQNPSITIKELAEITGISTSTINREIANVAQHGIYITRTGGKTHGKWVVRKKPRNKTV